VDNWPGTLYKDMNIYDIAVIGGGAAGCMAAITAGERDVKTILIEKNSSIGRKLLITGKGRCNITNIASLDTFLEEFGKNGEFFRTAFFKFFNKDLINFFESKGLRMKTERQGRVFPVTDSAYSVIEILEKSLIENKVKIMYNAHVSDIKKEKDIFIIKFKNKESIKSKKLILATGGISYKATGSSGDGFFIAEKTSHSVTPLNPALVPLITKEHWVKKLKGLALKNICITFHFGKKKVVSSIGEMMFTHFGISGPLVLDMSGKVVSFLKEHESIKITIDLKPALSKDKLNNKFIGLFKNYGKTKIKNIMKDFLPHALIPVFLELSKVEEEKTASQITKSDRENLLDLLKALTLTIKDSLPVEEAMVTAGGVSFRDINPRTMESKVMPGLYFAGEIIEGYAKSGGFNLQEAFSTGFLAGEEASK
jgi:predicted Rossmann fold flavoprotein